MERKIEDYNDNNDDNDDNDDSYIKKYMIYKKLNNSLKQLLGISIDKTTISNDWKPPIKHGLENSDQIIQPYFTNKEIKYTEILKDNIRNMRPLSEDQIKYVITLNKDDLYDFIKTFNIVNQSLVEIVNS